MSALVASGSPLRWLSSCSTVIGVRTAASSGSHGWTGSFRASRPSATSCSTTAAVIGLVMLAIGNVWSAPIGMWWALSERPDATTSI